MRLRVRGRVRVRVRVRPQYFANGFVVCTGLVAIGLMRDLPGELHVVHLSGRLLQQRLVFDRA